MRVRVCVNPKNDKTLKNARNFDDATTLSSALAATSRSSCSLNASVSASATSFDTRLNSTSVIDSAMCVAIAVRCSSSALFSAPAATLAAPLSRAPNGHSDNTAPQLTTTTKRFRYFVVQIACQYTRIMFAAPRALADADVSPPSCTNPPAIALHETNSDSSEMSSVRKKSR
jgi:hypothetical protein